MTQTLTPITRGEAQRRGLRRYFTGKPCQHGHVCERYVKRQWCVECAAVGLKPEPKASAKYSTGKPCKYGHLSERYVSSGACVECTRLSFQRWEAKQRVARPSDNGDNAQRSSGNVSG